MTSTLQTRTETCTQCGLRERLPGKSATWCRECKNQWQREYRAGRKRQKRIPAPVVQGECLLWQGYVDKEGYGRVSANGKQGQYAHRVAYEREVGPIPEGLTLDHVCRNKTCVRTAHLEPVTRGENVRRHYECAG